jgi:hypothetical protein
MNSVSDTQALRLPKLMGLKQAGVHDDRLLLIPSSFSVTFGS